MTIREFWAKADAWWSGLGVCTRCFGTGVAVVLLLEIIVMIVRR